MIGAGIGLSSLFHDKIINSDSVVWVKLALVMNCGIHQPRKPAAFSVLDLCNVVNRGAAVSRRASDSLLLFIISAST